ncbi:MAG TPA: hypothetical protein VNG89_23235 [Vicinamibacterales bacterium]|nr:hypothetical protein [Vicinamibacterales bacterium]
MRTHSLSWCAAAVALLLRGGLADMTGEWSVVGTFDRASGRAGPERRVELVCAFEQHDRSLVGTCRPANGPEGAPVSGTARETTVEWSFEVAPNAAAARQTATFRGTLDSRQSRVNGTFRFGTTRGTFRATKQ